MQEKPGGHPISITLDHITLDQIIVWLVIGAIAGMLVGAVVKRSRKGFGGAANLGIGLVGALIGGLLFRVFGLDLGLGRISVSLEDIVAAFAGSIVFLVILRFFKNR
jgi:uncharacterized membrane protein YeaQ/YmgE (transglycosylase-associated protein family)